MRRFLNARNPLYQGMWCEKPLFEMFSFYPLSSLSSVRPALVSAALVSETDSLHLPTYHTYPTVLRAHPAPASSTNGDTHGSREVNPRLQYEYPLFSSSSSIQSVSLTHLLAWRTGPHAHTPCTRLAREPTRGTLSPAVALGPDCWTHSTQLTLRVREFVDISFESCKILLESAFVSLRCRKARDTDHGFMGPLGALLSSPAPDV